MKSSAVRKPPPAAESYVPVHPPPYYRSLEYYPTLPVLWRNGSPDWTGFFRNVSQYVRRMQKDGSADVALYWWRRQEFSIGQLRNAGVIDEKGRTGEAAADAAGRELAKVFPGFPETV